MARPVKPLSEARIASLQAVDKPIKLADGGGMYLLVQPDGARYWRMDYRYGSKRRTLALGVYPQVSLDEARTRRETARFQLASGLDPVAEKKAARAGRRPAGDEQTFALEIIGEGVWTGNWAAGGCATMRNGPG